VQNVIERAWHMNELRYIVVVELKVLERKEMLNVFEVTRYQVVHTNDVVSFFDKTVAQV
jgi:hypothetical protein